MVLMDTHTQKKKRFRRVDPVQGGVHSYWPPTNFNPKVASQLIQTQLTWRILSHISM